MNKLLNWKSIFSITVLFLVFMLFQVFKTDFMALPDSGFSRGIELDTIKIDSGYENYMREHYATAVYQDRLYLISSDIEGLHVKVFDAQATLMDAFTLPDYKGFTKLKASVSGDNLILNTFTSSNNECSRLTIHLNTKTATKEMSHTIPDYRALLLTPDYTLYSTDEALKLVSVDQSIDIAQPDFLETLTLTLDPEDKSLWIAYTEFVDGQYHLNLKHLDKSYHTLGDFQDFYTFNASGSDKPSELTLHVSNGQVQILSVLKNQKMGINTAYVLRVPQQQIKEPDVKVFNAYNYSLQPQFFDFNDGAQLIISSKTSIGKVEIGANGSFENLILLSKDFESAQSLTKSTLPSLQSQMHQIGDHHYLTYIQIKQGVGKILLSSDKPELVERSKHSNLGENLSLLMTTLTTFLPLSYIGLIAEAYILTPVMAIIVLISMFFLTWAERNSTKLLITGIVIHMAAKNLFIFRHIVQSPEVFSNFPSFLDSPLKLFLWSAAMSCSALYCLWHFRKKHPNTHYFYQYFVFNLIDITYFTMLFTPYYLLI